MGEYGLRLRFVGSAPSEISQFARAAIEVDPESRCADALATLKTSDAGMTIEREKFTCPPKSAVRRPTF